ncbi:MAG: hypothetical protein IJC74_04580 [Clostridia bacterium]|nr:hypothetical protein [Clostridia bacterium]
MRKTFISMLLTAAIIMGIMPTIAFANSPQKYSPKASKTLNGHTYQLFDESMTWEEAKAYCESIGGHLTTVTSGEEQKVIENLLENGTKNQYWLGLSRLSGKMEWVTDESLSYANWDNGEPNGKQKTNAKELYIHIYNKPNPAVGGSKRFKWNDMFNDNTYPGEENFFSLDKVGFICEFPSSDVSDAASSINYNGKIYALYNDDLSWDNAKARCEAKDGHLATITSEEEQKAVCSLFSYVEMPRASYWIGGYKQDSEFKWVTNEPMEYQHWSKGEPNGRDKNNMVMQIFTPSKEDVSLPAGYWDDTWNDGDKGGGIKVQGYILELPANGYKPNEINVLVNGIYVDFDYAPFIQNGRTLVPIRAIAEALGSNVEWNESTQTAVIQRGLETAVFQIDKNKVFAKETIYLDVAAQVVNNRTYIPVRALSEIFGASVKWDEATNTVIINTEELTDEAIFRDFCDNGFYDFDYFSQCFMEEHMSGGIFNSYMWQNAASHLSDWAKKVVTFKFDNYEEDAYKENLKLLLSNVTATPNVDAMKAASNALATKIIEGLGKTKGFEVDELCDFINKNIDTLSDNELFTYLAIGEDAKMLGDAMDKAGIAINIAALTVEDLAFIFTDFSQNAYYLHKIKEAAGEGCDKALKDAIDSLMLDYTDKYVKVINDVGKFAYTTVLEMGTSAILKFAGSSVGSLYAISAFVIEQGATALGAKKYSENVESAIFLMGIHNNIVHDNYNKTKSNIVNYNVAPDATEDSWLNFVQSFELTRACTVEAYKCMKEVTEDVAEQIYLEKQMDIAKRLTISSTLPKNGEKIFTLN